MLRSTAEARSALRVCFADTPFSQALTNGDCIFCGRALIDHEPVTFTEHHTEYRFDKETRQHKPVKVPTRETTRWIDIHHLIWQCVEEELGDKWPPDEQNGVWVGYQCHREYHRKILREVNSPNKWTLTTYKKYVAERDFGILSLNRGVIKPEQTLVAQLTSLISIN